MRRSDLDLLVGDLLRKGVALRCPFCGTVAKWTGVPEYDSHRRACSTIQLGLVVGEVLPVVAKKPKGFHYTTWPDEPKE